MAAGRGVFLGSQKIGDDGEHFPRRSQRLGRRLTPEDTLRKEIAITIGGMLSIPAQFKGDGSEIRYVPLDLRREFCLLLDEDGSDIMPLRWINANPPQHTL